MTPPKRIGNYLYHPPVEYNIPEIDYSKSISKQQFTYNWITTYFNPIIFLINPDTSYYYNCDIVHYINFFNQVLIRLKEIAINKYCFVVNCNKIINYPEFGDCFEIIKLEELEYQEITARSISLDPNKKYPENFYQEAPIHNALKRFYLSLSPDFYKALKTVHLTIDPLNIDDNFSNYTVSNYNLFSAYYDNIYYYKDCTVLTNIYENNQELTVNKYTDRLISICNLQKGFDELTYTGPVYQPGYWTYDDPENPEITEPSKQFRVKGVFKYPKSQLIPKQGYEDHGITNDRSYPIYNGTPLFTIDRQETILKFGDIEFEMGPDLTDVYIATHYEFVTWYKYYKSKGGYYWYSRSYILYPFDSIYKDTVVAFKIDLPSKDLPFKFGPIEDTINFGKIWLFSFGSNQLKLVNKPTPSIVQQLDLIDSVKKSNLIFRKHIGPTEHIKPPEEELKDLPYIPGSYKIPTDWKQKLDIQEELTTHITGVEYNNEWIDPFTYEPITTKNPLQICENNKLGYKLLSRSATGRAVISSYDYWTNYFRVPEHIDFVQDSDDCPVWVIPHQWGSEAPFIKLIDCENNEYSLDDYYLKYFTDVVEVHWNDNNTRKGFAFLSRSEEFLLPPTSTGGTGGTGGLGKTGGTGAIGSSGSSGGTGGSGCSGGTGYTGETGDTGGIGGTGSTGGVGPTGHTGGTGGIGPTGGTGEPALISFTGGSGGIGNIGPSGGTGFVGNTGSTGGSGNTGPTGGTGGYSENTGGTGATGYIGELGGTGGIGPIGETGGLDVFESNIIVTPDDVYFKEIDLTLISHIYMDRIKPYRKTTSGTMFPTYWWRVLPVQHQYFFKQKGLPGKIFKMINDLENVSKFFPNDLSEGYEINLSDTYLLDDLNSATLSEKFGPNNRSLRFSINDEVDQIIWEEPNTEIKGCVVLSQKIISHYDNARGYDYKDYLSDTWPLYETHNNNLIINLKQINKPNNQTIKHDETLLEYLYDSEFEYVFREPFSYRMNGIQHNIEFEIHISTDTYQQMRILSKLLLILKSKE